MAAVHERAVLVEAATGAECDVWTSIARSYAAFTSPLVPCREDIAVYEQAVAMHAATIHANGLDAVMLGVTPGVALMRWPAGSRILAVDLSPGVIRALWPGDVPGMREAKCASWFDIPKAQQSCDVVVGDGSLIACRFPGEVRTLARYLSELLKAGGMLVLRCYVRPDKPETVDDVFDALFGPEGMNVDCFKIRLWMAMQRSPEEGVAVREAARVLARYRLNARAMRDRLGWSNAVIEPFFEVADLGRNLFVSLAGWATCCAGRVFRGSLGHISVVRAGQLLPDARHAFRATGIGTGSSVMSRHVAMLAGTTGVVMITAVHLWHQLRVERELNGQLLDRVTDLETMQARQSQSPAVVSIPSSLPAQAAEPQESGARMPSVPIPEAPGANRSQSLNLRELLKDPDYRDARRAQIRMQLPLAFPDLAKELGLSPPEADAFFDLMVRQQMDRMMLAPGPDDSDDVRQQVQREVAELARTSQSEIADLLGPARNQEWQDYQKTLNSRQQVVQLRTMLSTAGYPLTDAQAAPLLATIVSEQQRLIEEARLRTYPGDPRGQMEIAEENLKAAEESNQRILYAAPSYLNSQQLEALKSWMAQQLNMSRAMARARRAQPESEGISPTASP